MVGRAVPDVSEGSSAFATLVITRQTTQYHTLTDMIPHHLTENLKFLYLYTAYVGINLHCNKSNLFSVKMYKEMIVLFDFVRTVHHPTICI